MQNRRPSDGPFRNDRSIALCVARFSPERIDNTAGRGRTPSSGERPSIEHQRAVDEDLEFGRTARR